MRSRFRSLNRHPMQGCVNASVFIAALSVDGWEAQSWETCWAESE
jgi:hypothetical protein